MTENHAYGIDLGTTFSLLAEARGGQARVIPLSQGAASLPSVVRVRPQEVVVGAAAVRAQALDPDNTIGFFKTEMGRAGAAYDLGGREWTPQQLSAEVLRALATEARAAGAEVRRAVVTIPAYFGDMARMATLEAAHLAGIEVVELIHEPTAAAIAYGIGATGAGAETVLVYDLGGGTFDVSIVRLAPGKIDVLATTGDHALGGKDFDDTLVELIAGRFGERHGVDPMDDPADLAVLRTQAQELKLALTDLDRSECSVVAQGIADVVEVTRTEFEAQSRSLMTRTADLVQRALQDAHLAARQLDGVLLVGGSTRMPMCRQLVATSLGHEPRTGLNPHQVVALGAALRTEAMLNEPGRRVLAARRLQDVTAHALGFVVLSADEKSYVNDVMIPRNAPIPARMVKRRAVRNRAGGANELHVHLLQGDNRRPSDNEALGRFTFTGLPPGSGETIIDIAFGYNEDGIVQIVAAVDGCPLAPPLEDRDDLNLSWTDEPPRPATVPLDVMIALDVSGSMSGSSMSAANSAVREFVAQLPSDARLGLVSFNHQARIDAPIGSSAGEVIRAVQALVPGGGTEMHRGLLKASEQLQGESLHPRDLMTLSSQRADAVRRRVVVILSDGATDRGRALQAAASIKRAAIDIVPVGIPGADHELLDELATIGRGAFFTSVEGLAGTFGGIARELVAGTGLVR
ncbi:MAG: Hsp70 family protein [Solirubrobacteraceae bacterium]